MQTYQKRVATTPYSGNLPYVNGEDQESNLNYPESSNESGDVSQYVSDHDRFKTLEKGLSLLNSAENTIPPIPISELEETKIEEASQPEKSGAITTGIHSGVL